MRLYALAPLPAHAGDPAWAGSVHREPCFVWAPSESWARGYAEAAFRRGAASPLGEITPDMPWRHARLVGCCEVPDPGAGQPEGTIEVPYDGRTMDAARVRWEAERGGF